jgi:hypothetical protein
MDLPGTLWSPSEASAVNEFLNTPVGKKWLLVLLTRKPRIDLSSADRAAMTGSFAAGYEHLLLSEIPMTRVALKSADGAQTKPIDMIRD